MKYLLFTLSIILLAGSVQGRVWTKHTPHALHCYNAMDRDSVSAYCTMSYDHRYWDEYVSIDSGVYHTRRPDRWYSDTVQVCDTVRLRHGSYTYDGITGVETFTLTVTCRDTTIYKKKIEKTETKWVIPE